MDESTETRRMPYGRWARVVVAAVGITIAGGCAGRPEEAKPRDVLLVTIDTARADRFSYTGSPGPGTPRVDALAGRGAVFLDAISPVPLTLPAHASLMTGRVPPAHSVRDNGAYRLPDSETTLAEVLAAAGFSTGAFVGAQVLDARYGLGQGFGTYDDAIDDPGESPFLYYAERSGERVVAAAARWLDARSDGPVFAWVHLFDPHTPYRPPEPERSRHASPYDGEIAYVDRVVGSLLDHWGSRRELERALVIVTSDHGEALGEHGEPTHGVLVHDATLRVPLVVAGPGIRGGLRIAAPVSLIDVMPTVLGMLGIDLPSGLDGRDLSAALRGGTVPWSPAAGYAESLYAKLHHACTPLLALREGGWKLVRGRGDEVFDLASDPGETRDLAAIAPDKRRALGVALEALTASFGDATSERLPLDEEARRALESLGYVWSTSPAGQGEAARDPREALQSLRKMAEADRRLLDRDLAGALSAYREVLAVEPSSVDARYRMAHLLIASGRAGEAVDWLAQAVAIAPHEPFLFQKLGATLESLDRFADALETFDRGLAVHPSARPLRDGRWRCLDRLGRHETMAAEADRAVAQDPSDGVARYARVIARFGRSPTAVYRAAIERELRELPGDPTLRSALAKASREGGGPEARPPRKAQ